MRDALSASVARLGAPLFFHLYRADRALRRKLTPAGWLAAALLVASAVFGLNTRESLIHQLFGLSLGLILVAAIASWRFRLDAKVTRSLPQVATAGVAFDYVLAVRNLGGASHGTLHVEEML